MSDLKLSRLPDRTPVKLTITVLPKLHQALVDYAALYAEVYQQQESIADLIPAMVLHFLENDRAFQRFRATRPGTGD